MGGEIGGSGRYIPPHEYMRDLQGERMPEDFRKYVPPAKRSTGQGRGALAWDH